MKVTCFTPGAVSEHKANGCFYFPENPVNICISVFFLLKYVH